MKKYLSVKDIAQITHKEHSTVFRWVKSGKLGQVRRVGNEYQVPLESFERWWKENVQVINSAQGGE